MLVVAHKVVSKAEGRTRSLAGVEPGAEAQRIAAAQGKDPRLVQAVLDESAARGPASAARADLRDPHGFVCANAGVDRSNTGDAEEVVLLPEDPDASARALRAAPSGPRPPCVIADSFGRAWRLGQTDVALGAAGLVALDDWRGRADAAGRAWGPPRSRWPTRSPPPPTWRARRTRSSPWWWCAGWSGS